MSDPGKIDKRQVKWDGLDGSLEASSGSIKALKHNKSASTAPDGTASFAAGYSIGSLWFWGKRTWRCYGDAEWEELQGKSEKGAVNGYASIESSGFIPRDELAFALTPPQPGDLHICALSGTQTRALWRTKAQLNIADTSHTHTASDIVSGELPVTRGGTGADNAADARTNLDVPSIGELTDGLAAKQDVAEKGQPGGYASLDGSGLVPASQLPAVGGGVDWGDIGGALADQSDLQNALEGKFGNAHEEALTNFSDHRPLLFANTGSIPPDEIIRGANYHPAGPRYRGHVQPGERTFFSGGHIVTSGSYINTEGGSVFANGGVFTNAGNLQAGNGGQVGWTLQSQSPTGSGTNCHINSSGKLVRQTSQGKLKEDQAPLETTIDEIMAWQPKSFRWVEEMGGHEDIGLIAEEVSAIDPRAAWHDHDQILTTYEEPEDPEDPESDPVEKERYQCCPEQPVVPLGVHYERAWVHLLAATQDFYRRYQEERAELLARIEALEGKLK